MKLGKLKKRVKKLIKKHRKGVRIKEKKITKILRELEAKEDKYKQALDAEESQKTQQNLKLKLAVTRAQIQKARKLLSELDSES